VAGPRDTETEPVDTASRWAGLLAGFAGVFALFHGSAAALGSDRGQAGVLVCAIVLAAIFLVERTIHGAGIAAAARTLGLGPPRAIGLAVACGVSALLLAIPLLLRARGAAVTLVPGWWALVPGLFAQAGIAEETLFRGYLFGRLRRGRSFWRAAWLSTLPFVSVHLLLFFTMPWAVALAAVLLSVALSFPLAQLYELGGRTIWPAALVHAVVQGTIKILDVPGHVGAWFPIAWMAASALLPLLAFFAPRPADPGASSRP
jgi:membrane protease YdiL (CAAX protease family)